jgi:hypothetical protein
MAVLVELVMLDLSVNKRFHGGLFGRHFRDRQIGGVDYAEASPDGQLVAALMHKAVDRQCARFDALYRR